MHPPLHEIVLFYDPVPHPAALNMAVDELLLKTAQVPLLRCYRWERQAVSIGYFEREEVVRANWPGREMVRRWTGGGTVLHGEDFTYTLVVPKGDPFSARNPEDSYAVIHQVIAGLIGGDLARERSEDHSTPCFQNPTRSDVLLAGVKVAGAAQRRTRWGLLHQGSIQGMDQPEVARWLGDRFPERLAAALGETVSRENMTPGLMEAAAALARERYGTREWTERF